jgi:hypothetical protein
MPKCTDKLGREWELGITVADLKALREVGFDFVTFIPEKASAVLFDPEQLMRVLRVFAHVPKETPDDEFNAGFDGPAMQRAGEALLEACADFSPHSRLAAWLRGRYAKGLEILATATARVLESNLSASNSPAESPASPSETSAA